MKIPLNDIELLCSQKNSIQKPNNLFYQLDLIDKISKFALENKNVDFSQSEIMKQTINAGNTEIFKYLIDNVDKSTQKAYRKICNIFGDVYQEERLPMLKYLFEKPELRCTFIINFENDNALLRAIRYKNDLLAEYILSADYPVTKQTGELFKSYGLYESLQEHINNVEIIKMHSSLDNKLETISTTRKKLKV